MPRHFGRLARVGWGENLPADMANTKNIIIAAKCKPKENLFIDIKRAGLEAVELYLSEEVLTNVKRIIELCGRFPFKYAIHAPNDSCNLHKLAELTQAISPKAVVFHNIYWEDEWKLIVKNFKNIQARLCIENTYSIHEPLKFMRRYGMGRCLDLEHLQMECCGIYEEEFIKLIKQTSHIHLTGYIYGSRLWHTHIHHSPRHNLYLLDLLKRAGYSGFVVSEAKVSLQAYAEFRKLSNFYRRWRKEA